MAANIATARAGSKVIGIGAIDVRKVEDLEKAAARCAKELGGIDYCIAGAAGNFLAPISGLSANAFRTVIEIDTIGSFNTLKATLPYLIESAAKNPNNGANPSTGGRIIFVSATFHFKGMALQAHVSAAKAGVDALSACTAIEYGPRGITSNIITPGPIMGTEGMARLGSRDAEKSGAAFKKVPLGRYGTVKEIADGTVYLFSDAGNYVNGEVLVIDGGEWRAPNGIGGAKQYPDYLLDGTFTRREPQKQAKL
jgi:peroxisomal 2,4-dienoyl-CoA reductase